DVLLGVEDLRRLGLDRGNDPRMGVAGVRDPDPAAVVEIALAVRRDEPRALSAVDHQVRDPAPDRRDDRGIGEGRGGGSRVRPECRRHRRRRAEITLENRTNATAPRKTIEPITLICTGRAFFWMP